MERLVPVRSDYEDSNNPFLLEVERAELDSWAIRKAKVVEETSGVTLVTSTHQNVLTSSHERQLYRDHHNHQDEDNELEQAQYTVLGKRTDSDENLQYLIDWL